MLSESPERLTLLPPSMGMTSITTTTQLSTSNSSEKSETKSTLTKEEIEEKRKKLIMRGVVGLENMGNTCYMNSAIQVLSNTYLMREYLLLNKKNAMGTQIAEVYGCFRDDLLKKVHEKIITEKKEKKENTEIIPTTKELNTEIKNTVSYNFLNLLQHMWSEHQVSWEPRQLKNVIGNLNSTFKGFNQNDSQELLSFIIDSIHEETKREEDLYVDKKYLSQNLLDYINKVQEYEKLHNECRTLDEKIKLKQLFKQYSRENIKETVIYEYIRKLLEYKSKNQSVISDLLTGYEYHEVTCKECGNITIRFEPYQLLSFPLPNSSSNLEECIKQFTTEETLSGSNQYRCSECNKKVDATKRCYIWDTPDYVFIQLKRFVNNGVTTMKNSNLIKFPLKDLSFDTASSQHYPRNKKYELYAVIQHSGSLHGGHYYTHAKNTLNNKWYEFNDSHVTHIPDNDVENSVISDTSYILAYKRQGLEEPFIENKNQ